ncbi:MAG: DUF6389 family protein [Bordetella sp.]|nr:DUF6389 family protein [Bordetella sp.]
MTQADYRQALLAILDQHRDAARATLLALIAALPERAREIHFAIHPDQDGEGTFSIVASLDGPDLFVLNRAVEPHRYLFDVRHTERGVEPEVPMFAPGETDFDVQDTIVDTAMEWVESLWNACARNHTPLPGMVYGEEGYGTREPILLAR